MTRIQAWDPKHTDSRSFWQSQVCETSLTAKITPAHLLPSASSKWRCTPQRGACCLPESFLQRHPKPWPTSIEHDCPEFGGVGNQNHSLLSVIQKNPEFSHLHDQGLMWMRQTCTDAYSEIPWEGHTILEKQELQNSESTRTYQGFRRYLSVKTTFFWVSHEEGFEHAIPLFVAGGFMSLRGQCPSCGVTTFCMINWLQITAQDAKLTGRKQVIK